jgi:hypothetical protein
MFKLGARGWVQWAVIVKVRGEVQGDGEAKQSEWCEVQRDGSLLWPTTSLDWAAAGGKAVCCSANCVEFRGNFGSYVQQEEATT